MFFKKNFCSSCIFLKLESHSLIRSEMEIMLIKRLESENDWLNKDLLIVLIITFFTIQLYTYPSPVTAASARDGA